MRGAPFPRSSVRAGPGCLAFALAVLLASPAQAELLGGAAAPTDVAGPVSAQAGLAPAQGFDAPMEGAALSGKAAGGGAEVGQAAEIDRGKVSWYGGRFHGRRTASGEKFDMHDLTAAHKTLPFGTRVKVRDLGTGKEVEVRINDRGPHVRGRIIDLSRAAALALGVLHAGEAAVALLLP